MLFGASRNFRLVGARQKEADAVCARNLFLRFGGAHNPVEGSKNGPLDQKSRGVDEVSNDPQWIRLAVVVFVRRSKTRCRGQKDPKEDGQSSKKPRCFHKKALLFRALAISLGPGLLFVNLTLQIMLIRCNFPD